eukprot:12882750-Prorocentrum_lima.AAC.1
MFTAVTAVALATVKVELNEEHHAPLFAYMDDLYILLPPELLSHASGPSWASRCIEAEPRCG